MSKHKAYAAVTDHAEDERNLEIVDVNVVLPLLSTRVAFILMADNHNLSKMRLDPASQVKGSTDVMTKLQRRGAADGSLCPLCWDSRSRLRGRLGHGRCA